MNSNFLIFMEIFCINLIAKQAMKPSCWKVTRLCNLLTRVSWLNCIFFFPQSEEPDSMRLCRRQYFCGRTCIVYLLARIKYTRSFFSDDTLKCTTLQKSDKFNSHRTLSSLPNSAQFTYLSSASWSLQQLLLHLSCDASTLPMAHPGCSLLPIWGAPTNYTLYMEPQE